MPIYIRVSHLQFFWIFVLFQAGMNARHTKEQEKYRSSWFCTNIFQLILTFVSYNYYLVRITMSQKLVANDLNMHDISHATLTS